MNNIIESILYIASNTYINIPWHECMHAYTCMYINIIS